MTTGDLKVASIKTDTIKNQAGTSAMTINTAGVVTQPTKPMFRAVRSVDQSISNNSTTVIQFNDKSSNSELFDIGGYFNTGTYRYTPLVAGYYSFSMGVLLESAHYCIGTIRKNGTGQFHNRAWSESGLYSTAQMSGILYLDGVDDYVDGTIYHNVGGAANIRGLDAGLEHTYLCGFLIG